MDKLEEVVAEISKKGGNALAVEMDVTSDGSVVAAFESVRRRSGGPAMW